VEVERWLGMPNFSTPVSWCPACGHKFDRASNATGQDGPEPGDITLCFGCGVLLVFSEALEVRMPTVEEMRGFRSDERLMEALAHTRRLMAKVREAV
jgi:hypothetical protein